MHPAWSHELSTSITVKPSRRNQSPPLRTPLVVQLVVSAVPGIPRVPSSRARWAQ
jgi:hypothetical protein